METRRILIVDDQENVAMILAESLSRFENCVADLAYTGQSAIEKCRQTFFDIVVADYQLPDITGVGIAKTLQDISPKTIIILITALRIDMIDDSIDQENIHYFLEKPFHFGKFYETVEDALTYLPNGPK